ncbi:MAG TPA: hypothetical protein PKC28_06910, partial [Bdellovibrionales bacterium]|nr:hypothetical protein [Bdellovibrionales bacterium]
MNFVIDALVQPSLTSVFEVTLWMAILHGIGGGSLGGFPRESYLAYSLWAVFVGRTTSNWMYEFQMLHRVHPARLDLVQHLE